MLEGKRIESPILGKIDMYSADLLWLHCNCSYELLTWVCMLVPALIVNASAHARKTSKTWLLLCECDQMFVCYSHLHIVVLMSGCMVLILNLPHLGFWTIPLAKH